MKFLLQTSFALFLFFSFPVYAEIAVIVHPENTSELSQKDINRLFLGKLKKFPNGNKVVPLYLAAGHSARDDFNKKVLRKSENQLKAYWSKLIFTGKGNPPDSVGNPADLLEKVASDKSMIAYIDAGQVTDLVRVVAIY